MAHRLDWDRAKRFEAEVAAPKDRWAQTAEGTRVWRGRPPKAPLRGDARADAVADFLRRRAT